MTAYFTNRVAIYICSSYVCLISMYLQKPIMRSMSPFFTLDNNSLFYYLVDRWMIFL